jgi:hypothetical protein
MNKSLGYFCIILCLLLCSGTPVFSQEELVLSVSPVRIELEGERGQLRVEWVELTNKGSHQVTIETSMADFSAEGEEGRPRFLPTEKHSWSISNWIETDPARFFLEPGESKEVEVTIHIPENAAPGGHYAAVLFSSVPSDPSATAVIAKIGTLLLLRIPGEIIEYGMAALSVQRLTDSTPVDFSILFTNEGNVHVKPEGTIKIRRPMGKKVTELKAGGENVLPQSSRRFTVLWEDVPTAGIFTAQGEFTYGSSANIAVSQKITFVVLPWRLILGGLTFFLAGTAFALLFRRKEAGKNKKISYDQ